MTARCVEIGIDWLASAFSPEDVDFLERMGCPRYKISAYEMLDGDLINAVVKTGKPLIMSVRSTDRVTILLATDYEGDLPMMGVSNHAAEPMQAHFERDWTMVERHIMLPDVPCEDQAFSSTPDEFAAYVSALR